MCCKTAATCTPLEYSWCWLHKAKKSTRSCFCGNEHRQHFAFNQHFLPYHYELNIEFLSPCVYTCNDIVVMWTGSGEVKPSVWLVLRSSSDCHTLSSSMWWFQSISSKTEQVRAASAKYSLRISFCCLLPSWGPFGTFLKRSVLEICMLPEGTSPLSPVDCNHLPLILYVWMSQYGKIPDSPCDLTSLWTLD